VANRPVSAALLASSGRPIFSAIEYAVLQTALEV
jgi:hypothetical protein